MNGLFVIPDRIGLRRIGGFVVAGMLLVASAAAQTSESAKTANGAECENYDPAWSPDGSSIAFAYQGEGEEHTAIWVASADGGDPVPVTDNGRTAFFPRWSPDGGEIAFMVRQDSWDIFVVSVDGTGERRLLPASW